MPPKVQELLKRTKESEPKKEETPLGRSLAQLDDLIPEEGLMSWSEGLTGQLADREKRFSSDTAEQDIREAIRARFPDPAQQEQILNSSTEFLQHLASALEEDEYQTVPLGQADRFLEGFPKQMFDELGEGATTEEVSRIFRLGGRAIEHYQEMPGGKYWGAGDMALFVGETIPHVLAAAGDKREAVLEQIEEAGVRLSSSNFQRFLSYTESALQEVSPEEENRLASLKDRLERIDPQVASLDDEPWNKDSMLETVRRAPTWGDLASLVLTTELNKEDNFREYGLVMSHRDNDPILKFIRGGDGAIINKAQQSAESVFFHTHPSPTDHMELVGPIISPGDLAATDLTDYGGGYLNVATTSGVTLHIGSEMVEARNDVYRLETGDKKGEIIGTPGRITRSQGDEMASVRQHLKDTRQPYIYSTAFENRKYYFAHIPWEHVDTSVNFNDISFGDGLPKVLVAIPDKPDIPQAPNLHQALRQTKSIKSR